MISSVGFTISGLIFTLLIAIIYFSKKKYKEVENKIYGFLLLWTIFLLLLELYCVFAMRIRNIHPILNEILCRIYILGCIIWFLAISVYILVLNSQKNYKSLAEVIRRPIVNIFVFICLGAYIISCFLPLSYTSGINNELYVIGGKGVYVLYFISAFIGIYQIYLLFRNPNKASFFKRLPIFFFLVFYFVMFVIQYFYTDINDLTFMFGLAIVAMYFTIVSQDYKLVKDLEVAKEEAEKANKEKTEFLSRMSHEIRTPMNAIMGFSESLLNDKDITESKIIEDTKNIYIAGNNLVSTINNILDVSNIESGKVKLEESKYFIGDIIFDLQKFVEARIKNVSVNFIIDFDENTPCVLYGDKKKIHKVLLNILSNSTKYTTSGEISLKIETVCDKGVAYLKFIINDTGVGIKEEDFDKVFKKFAKIESDASGLESGAGLGLNISKALVELMGGKISVSSQYNIGTTFIVELKNKIIDYHKSGNILMKKESLNKSTKLLDYSDKRIMVVDDNKLNLKVADKLLRAYNFDVILVESGYSCLEKLKQKEQYDLIFLDQLMPDLSGIETIRKIKKLDSINVPPIILTSANMTNELKDAIIKEGFSGYLSKPIDSDKLSGIIRYYFKK